MDAELRQLEREVAANPSDITAMTKLINAKTRNGEPITVYWKIRNKQDGKFCSGNLTASSDYGNQRSLFSSEGKTWTDKTELFKFIKKALASRRQNLIDSLKNSEVIEFRTVEFGKTPLTNMFEQAETEILKAEHAELERLLAEKAKELAKRANSGSV